MGSCLNVQKTSSTSHNSMIIEISPASTYPFSPKLIPNSYFYHLLRKQISSQLTSSSSSKTQIINLSQQTYIHPSSKLSPDQISKQLKVIYDLKTLVVIDQLSDKSKLSAKLVDVLEKFVEVGIKPSRVFVMYKVKQFEKEYPIFVNVDSKLEPKYVNMNIPLLIFDSKDVSADKGVKQLKIYLHSTSLYQDNQHINPKFYEQYFKIKKQQIINLTTYKSGDIINYSHQHTNLLIIHKSTSEVKDISKQIVSQLSDLYSIDPYNITFYLSQRIPFISEHQSQIGSLRDIISSTPFIMENKSIKHLKTEFQIEDKQSQLKRLLFDYYNQCKSLETTEDIFKLLGRLLENLTKEDNNEIWRTIKPTKAQYSQKLFKYQSGFKLIQSIGFKKKGDVYYNQIENKYLKIFKIDLLLAFKGMKEKIEQ